ncbi:MAG: ribose-5-phosphate isomerase RpiA [Longimicrobiales bacterium]
MSDRESQKRRAAERAVELVQDGMKLGLGTGSTARHVLHALAARRARGELPDIVGVATSNATEQEAIALGIPIRPLNDLLTLDLGIDGADEVDACLDVIKGLGGALLWEKIVAYCCREFVVVADESKLVERLGLVAPLPVEVVQFGWKTHLDAMREFRSQAQLRVLSGGEPFVTDGGHYILDCRFENGIPEPGDVDTAVRNRPGVVETGLFVDIVKKVIVAGPDDVRILERQP